MTSRLKTFLLHVWNHAERFAAILSILALGLSIYGIFQSRAAQYLAEHQYISERMLVLTGKIEDNSLILSPVDDEFRLQQGFCYFPESLDASREFISPDCKISLVLTEFRLQELFKNLIKPLKNNVQYMPYGVIPIVIDAQYVAKNEVFEDRGFYMLSYSVLQTDEPFENPKIEFRGLLFVNRTSRQSDASKIVESSWSEILSKFLRTNNTKIGEHSPAPDGRQPSASDHR